MCGVLGVSDRAKKSEFSSLTYANNRTDPMVASRSGSLSMGHGVHLHIYLEYSRREGAKWPTFWRREWPVHVSGLRREYVEGDRVI